MRIWMLTLTLVSSLLAAATTASAHDDVVPYALAGKIVTGGHDDGTLTDTIATRVFGFDFGEEPSDPYFIGDPGFNNGGFSIGMFPNNGLLPAGFTLGFDVVTNLQYWNGAGSVDFLAAPGGVELGLQRGSFTMYVSGLGQTGTVPTIGSTGASGRLHVHLGSLLNYTDGIDPAAPNPPDGIYLLGLTLKLPGSGLADSDTLYFVYNNGLSEGIHDQAMDWVQTELVPEPSTWLLFSAALAAVVGIGRRKRQRAA